jgi:hypothetical protein
MIVTVSATPRNPLNLFSFHSDLTLAPQGRLFLVMATLRKRNARVLPERGTVNLVRPRGSRVLPFSGVGKEAARRGLSG